MKAYRIENDSMGEVRVPAQALYGAQTQRAVDNFTIATTPLPWEFIRIVLITKQVAAQVHQKFNLLSATEAQAIIDAVDHLLSTPAPQHFPVSIYQTGSGTSTNMNINEVLATIAGHHGVTLSANDHVNMGQSSNDVIPSTMYLASALAVNERLLHSLTHLEDTLIERVKEIGHTVKTGRTHLMDAMPVSLSQEIGAWITQVRHASMRLLSVMPRLCELALGGTACFL